MVSSDWQIAARSAKDQSLREFGTSLQSFPKDRKDSLGGRVEDQLVVFIPWGPAGVPQAPGFAQFGNLNRSMTGQSVTYQACLVPQ